MLGSYGVAGQRLEEDRSGRVTISCLATILFARYLFSAFWEITILYRQLSDQFSKLNFKTIGVDKDCIRSFGKSVLGDLGRVFGCPRGGFAGAALPGGNFTPPFLCLIFASTSSALTSATFGESLSGRPVTKNVTEADGPPRGRQYGHSYNLLTNRSLVVQGRPPVDGPDRSPIKQSRAGLYEKGDHNQ